MSAGRRLVKKRRPVLATRETHSQGGADLGCGGLEQRHIAALVGAGQMGDETDRGEWRSVAHEHGHGQAALPSVISCLVLLNPVALISSNCARTAASVPSE